VRVMGPTEAHKKKEKLETGGRVSYINATPRLLRGLWGPIVEKYQYLGCNTPKEKWDGLQKKGRIRKAIKSVI